MFHQDIFGLLHRCITNNCMHKLHPGGLELGVLLQRTFNLKAFSASFFVTFSYAYPSWEHVPARQPQSLELLHLKTQCFFLP